MKTIGVVANCAKPRCADILGQLAGAASELGLKLVAAGETAVFLGRDSAPSVDEIACECDAIMVLGGDGTLLNTMGLLAGEQKPFIGVNIGGLGFLTSVSEADLETALRCLANDDYSVSVRAVAECAVVEPDGSRLSYRALNDVAVRSATPRIVSLDLSVGGETVTSYSCDGVLVSTPTGSTGHSLSAGGPIVLPETTAFVVSVICPHTLSSRPLVVPDTSAICVRVSGLEDRSTLAIDGQRNCSLAYGAEVTVRRSRQDVSLINLPGYSYFNVLRQKLHWRGSSAG